MLIFFGDEGQGVLRQKGVSYHPSRHHMSKNLYFKLSSPEAMQELVGSLEGTPAFQPGKAVFHGVDAFYAATVAQLSFQDGEIVAITREPRGSYLYLVRSHQYAPLTPQALARFEATLGEMLDRGRDQQEGYRLHLFSRAEEQRMDLDRD